MCKACRMPLIEICLPPSTESSLNTSTISFRAAAEIFFDLADDFDVLAGALPFDRFGGYRVSYVPSMRSLPNLPFDRYAYYLPMQTTAMDAT